MDKVNANLKWANGVVKENVGYAVGSEQMEAEGAARRAEANAEYKKAQAEGYAQGAGEKLKGNIKNTVGAAVGNQQMEAEGKASRVEGEARMKANS
ncbi:glutamate decarboxylase gad1 [Basidiobolus ranarum]|uniref:Glutamate decarboxylase gad1 n=1 Tax=Basidiobolus ranarum TaxID=34480 RepID=A0ABR2X244_9FUNG